MSESRTLTVTCLAGLSNRLRVLLSGMALAEATGREFAMHWAPSPPCGAWFHQLFENDWNVSAEVRFDAGNAIDLTHDAPDSPRDLLSVTEPSFSVVHDGWLISWQQDSAHLALQRRCRELNAELTPIPSIAKRIEEFRAAHFKPVMIGVHMRRGDFHFVHPKWLVKIETITRQVDAWLMLEPDAGILLCSDDGAMDPLHGRPTGRENLKEAFVQRYGERVVFTNPSSLDRRLPGAVQAALVDLWLLRSTQFFIGTPKSSFSEMAVFGREKG